MQGGISIFGILKRVLFFISNYGLKDLLKTVFSIIKHPATVWHLIQLLVSGKKSDAKRIFISFLPQSTKLKLPFLKSIEIQSEILSWKLEKELLVNSRTFTILIPVYLPEVRLLEEAVESVRAQSHLNWELLLVCDGLESANLVLESEKLSSWFHRIISGDELRDHDFVPGAINIVVNPSRLGLRDNTISGLRHSKGEKTVLMDQDDLIRAEALEALNLVPGNPDAIYTDHAVIQENGVIVEVFRKPSWSPMLAHQVMYLGHLKCFNTKLLSDNYTSEIDDFVADHIAFTKIAQIRGDVYHLPLVLAGWRIAESSLAKSPLAKPQVILNFERSIEALNSYEYLKFSSEFGPFVHRLTLGFKSEFEPPSLTVIIPTMWREHLVINLLEQIFPQLHANAKVIVIDTKSVDRPKEYERLQQKFESRLTTLELSEKFNFSKVNNFAVESSISEDILFLNDDVELLTHNTLEKMQAMLNSRGISIVGAKLLHPNGQIQHGGVAMGIRGTADHMYRNWRYDDGSAHGSAHWTREVSAVTGACLMIKKEIFVSVGGFNESYQTHYQDVDLCLKVSKEFGSIIQMQDVYLVHRESASRGPNYDFADRSLLLSSWNNNDSKDPYVIRSISDSSSESK
jgi:GT2 family glycosyltransferase